VGYKEGTTPYMIGRIMIDVITEDEDEIDYDNLLDKEDYKKLSQYAAQLVLTKEDSGRRIKEIGIDVHSHDTSEGDCEHCKYNNDEVWTNLN